MIAKIIKYQGSTGLKKWLLWISISVAVLLTVGALYWRIHQRQKEITKLRTESDLAAVQAETIRQDILREKNHDKLVGLLDQARELQNTADVKRKEIAKNEKIVEAELSQVKALRSWRDLDVYNKKSRS